jgi:outer membrane protein TolC
MTGNNNVMFNSYTRRFFRQHKIFKSCLIVFLFPIFVNGQYASDTLLLQATLDNCIQYAIQQNPGLKNAKLDEEIVDASIKSRLADWYPQINLNYNLQHNFKLPTININGNLIHTGLKNTSNAELGATQNIFNRDVLLALRTGKDVRMQAQQNIKEQNIDIAVLVSKAFYDIILTQQQIQVTEEDIVRIDRSLKDAYYQYQSGITDKTDYKRATISLNNARAQKRSGEESLKAKYVYLKQLMNYPVEKRLELSYDSAQMVNEIFIDTLQTVSYSNRIEVQQLETQKKLQQYNLQYYKWSFLPDVSAFGNYNFNYQNNSFSKLYRQNYPTSFVGLLLSFPIFQGGKRLQQIRQAQLELRQVDNSLISVQNLINTQYQQALSSYKSNLYNYYSLKENLALANEVYDVIRLQYRAGIKTYLEVINSETDLRTAQINFYNALYQLLASKIDVAQALGSINY